MVPLWNQQQKTCCSSFRSSSVLNFSAFKAIRSHKTWTQKDTNIKNQNKTKSKRQKTTQNDTTTQNTKHKTQNTKHKTQNTKHKTQLNSTQLNSTQLNSTQPNSTQHTVTSLKWQVWGDKCRDMGWQQIWEGHTRSSVEDIERGVGLLIKEGGVSERDRSLASS